MCFEDFNRADLCESIRKFRILGNPYKLERNLEFLVYTLEWYLINLKEICGELKWVLSERTFCRY